MLFMHHPPIDVGSPWLDRIGLADPKPLTDLVRSSPQVRVISTGHVHFEFEGRLGDAAVFAAPSTAIQFIPEGDEPRYDSRPPGYRGFILDGDTYQTNVVRLPELKYPPVQ